MNITLFAIKNLIPVLMIVFWIYFLLGYNQFFNRFRWQMVSNFNGCRFFIMILYAVLMLYNFFCYMIEPTWDVLLSGIFINSLLFYRWANRLLRSIRDSKVLSSFFLIALLGLFIFSGMSCIWGTFLTVAVAARMYPSSVVITKYYEAMPRIGESIESYFLREYFTVLEHY